MTHPIVEGMTEAVTMAKLMRENERLSDVIDVIAMQLQNTLIVLENEQRLADDLYIGSKGTANQITKAWAAYREARGL